MDTDDMLDGRYRILDLVGQGTFAYVYRARHSAINTLEVAIKVLKPEFVADKALREQFVHEAETVALLRNKHTVRITDMGRLPDGRPYIGMEFCSGIALNHLIRLYDYQSDGLIAHIADGVLQSLREAHDLDIIHRDIKPSNIIITDVQRGGLPLVRVLDFGIAHVIQSQSVDPEDNSSNFVFCTPSYASPEVLHGKPTKSADLYALGLTLAELIERRPVYANDGFYKVAERQTSSDPAPFGPRTRNNPLFPIIERACNKDPRRRFQSANQMLRALRTISESFDYSALRTIGYPIPIDCEVRENCASRHNIDALTIHGRCANPNCGVRLNPNPSPYDSDTPARLELDDFGTLKDALDQDDDAFHFEDDAFTDTEPPENTANTAITPRVDAGSTHDATARRTTSTHRDAATAPIPHRVSSQTELYGTSTGMRPIPQKRGQNAERSSDINVDGTSDETVRTSTRPVVSTPPESITPSDAASTGKHVDVAADSDAPTDSDSSGTQRISLTVLRDELDEQLEEHALLTRADATNTPSERGTQPTPYDLDFVALHRTLFPNPDGGIRAAVPTIILGVCVVFALFYVLLIGLPW